MNKCGIGFLDHLQKYLSIWLLTGESSTSQKLLLHCIRPYDPTFSLKSLKGNYQFDWLFESAMQMFGGYHCNKILPI